MNKAMFLISALALAGCASQPPAHQVSSGPKVKPQLMILTPEEQQSVDEKNAEIKSVTSQSSYLVGPDVVAYPIAGRQDPNHPDVAYLGTWALRRTASQWKLQAAPEKDVVFGPQRSEARHELKPAQTQEVQALLLEERALNDQNRQAITRLLRVQVEQQKQLSEIHQALVDKPKNEPAPALTSDPSVSPAEALPKNSAAPSS